MRRTRAQFRFRPAPPLSPPLVLLSSPSNPSHSFSVAHSPLARNPLIFASPNSIIAKPIYRRPFSISYPLFLLAALAERSSRHKSVFLLDRRDDRSRWDWSNVSSPVIPSLETLKRRLSIGRRRSSSSSVPSTCDFASQPAIQPLLSFIAINPIDSKPVSKTIPLLSSFRSLYKRKSFAPSLSNTRTIARRSTPIVTLLKVFLVDIIADRSSNNTTTPSLLSIFIHPI